MKPGHYLILVVIPLALFLVAVGCTQMQSEPIPAVYIIYGSEKGDLSYTDAAYQGILAAQQEKPFAIREFVPDNYGSLPALLNSTPVDERPGLIITVGFQYADLTQNLAKLHPEIRFLAIDQGGIGSDYLRAYEITSYGDSYLAGALAASATKSGHIGIIMGMQSDVLDTFRDGYADGAKAVNASIVIENAYVHRNSTTGFSDAVEAGRIADGMYRNGTDVIFTCAGYSNTGAFAAAKNATGRFVIGTDSDQSPLGPEIVLASAVKRVDRIVHTGITDHLKGTFSGGNRTVGLEDGMTGIICNPHFASCNTTVGAWESQAKEEERKYLLSHRIA